MLGREELEGSPLTVCLMSILSDDKLEDLEEANPFSFKEFLKTKNLGLTKEDTTNSRIYQKVCLRSCPGHFTGCLSLSCGGLDKTCECVGQSKAATAAEEGHCGFQQLFSPFGQQMGLSCHVLG